MLVFGLIYCSISLVNHYHFRTYAHDLGIYTQQVYYYAHFKWHLYTLGLEGIDINHLGNHFSPINMFFAPLYYIFGTWTMLVVQILAVLFGGFGIYKYAKTRLNDKFMPELIMILFYSMWGVYSALSFDYHTNVVGAMFIPWFVYYFERSNLKLSILFMMLVLISKENMALLMFFVILGLIIKQFVEKRKPFKWYIIAAMGVFPLIYFVIIQTQVMPAFNPHQVSHHMGNYGALGDSLGEMMVTIINEPRFAFSLLFEDFTDNVKYNGIKTELWFFVLVSGGIALIYRPYYLLMLATVFAQKMFSSNPMHWGIEDQYSIEFVPIIALAVADFTAGMKKKYMKYVFLILTVYLATHFNIARMEKKAALYKNPMQYTFYNGRRYKPVYDYKEIQKALKIIPPNASVSVGSSIGAHISDRDTVYHYPIIKEAEYIVIFSETDATYPFNREKYARKMEMIKEEGEYEVIYDANKLLIFRKIKKEKSNGVSGVE